MKTIAYIWSLLVFVLLLQACSDGDPVSAERFNATDQFVARMTGNIESNTSLELIADIDHSRLGHEAGSPMPPSRVLIFSNSQLESELIQLNPLVALELPLRILAFESGQEQGSNIITNTFDYLASRYQLGGKSLPGLAARYDKTMASVLSGIPPDAVVSFEDSSMQPDGIITIESPYSFEETIKRVRAAISAQDDTLYFGTVDFQARASEQGITLLPSYMILFGGPGPGGKAMVSAPTLGLDGFCQKFLVWQDEKGVTHLSFNDLLALARRQQVSIPIALRVIGFRLNSVFEKALAAQ